MVGKKEIFSFVLASEAGRKLFNMSYCKSFHYVVSVLPIVLVITGQCSNQIFVDLACTSASANLVTMVLYVKDS